jgi:hypothetical protein
LSCGQQLASLLQRKAQLLEIVVSPIDDGNADRFCWRVGLLALQACFDDYSHDAASIVNEMPVKPFRTILDD